MKHKLTKRVVLVLSVCVACVLAFGATLAKAEGNVDSGKGGENQLTVSVANDKSEYTKDAKAKLDLYRVGNAEKEANYDTYKYTFVDEFDGLNSGFNQETINKDGWQAKAEEAKSVVLKASVKPEPYVPDVLVGDTITNLPNGLYLVLVSDAQSEKYGLTFQPVLVALPSKVDSSGSPVYTTDQGTWTSVTNAVFLNAKWSIKPLTGSIKINKVVNNPTGDPATFTFHITNIEDNGTYDNYAAVMLSPDNEWSTTINNIPAGYTYTVTEVDSGAQYQTVGLDAVPVPVKVEAGETAEVQPDEVTFTNEPNGTGKQGYGIENHFVFKDGRWQEPEQRTINNNANE